MMENKQVSRPISDSEQKAASLKAFTLHRIVRSAMRVLTALVLCITFFGIWVTQPVWVHRGPANTTADQSRLQAHVRQISETFFPRSCLDPTNLACCMDYIGAQFAAAGAQVSTQRYGENMQGLCQPFHPGTKGLIPQYSTNVPPFGNVIARFGPATGACVVVGAHYDSCCRFPAADDNASGIAGLLEIARLLGHASPPATPILLVAYGTEEPPFFGTCGMGSYQHAKLLRRMGVEVKAMLALEMIGCFCDDPWSQTYPVPLLCAIYPTRGNFISIIGNVAQRKLIRTIKRGMKNATDLPVWSGSLPRNMPGVDFSDHRSYWAFDYSAVMITDTAFCRNHFYHKAGDTWDKLDYVRMAKVVDGVMGAIKAVGDGEAIGR